jgi:hypothetical protein
MQTAREKLWDLTTKYSMLSMEESRNRDGPSYTISEDRKKIVWEKQKIQYDNNFNIELINYLKDNPLFTNMQKIEIFKDILESFPNSGWEKTILELEKKEIKNV